MNRLCNNCTHDVLDFGVAHYSKKGFDVMGPSADILYFYWLTPTL